MMPKDKAQELIDKYLFVEIQNYTSMFEVKQCALIAVDEIIDSTPCDYNGVEFEPNIEYWLEVRNELEKL